MLCRDRNLAPHFLPIDFEDSKAAAKNNIRTKKMAQQCLQEDIPLLIFPSGFVSTADQKGFGKVVDAPWTTFAAKLIRDSEATVVPVYFEGQNSRLFHIASHISEPLRMALLLKEARTSLELRYLRTSEIPYLGLILKVLETAKTSLTSYTQG
jgi:putative hemolysin